MTHSQRQMLPLRQRLQALFDAGHTAPAPPLYHDSRIVPATRFKSAAVLIAFTDRPDPGLLLIHRPASMRSHPGQIAFPGGRTDPGESATQAALREAREELGLDPAMVDIIGATDLYRTGSGYEITPVLAVVPPDTPRAPNPDEVAEWFEAPARFVLNPANQTERHGEWQGQMHRYVEIMWQQHRIWGVTGAIIANLAHRLNWHD